MKGKIKTLHQLVFKWHHLMKETVEWLHFIWKDLERQTHLKIRISHVLFSSFGRFITLTVISSEPILFLLGYILMKDKFILVTFWTTFHQTTANYHLEPENGQFTDIFWCQIHVCIGRDGEERGPEWEWKREERWGAVRDIPSDLGVSLF